MLQIFIIILFQISSKSVYHYAHYYAQNLLIIHIILNFTGEFLQLFSLLQSKTATIFYSLCILLSETVTVHYNSCYCSRVLSI